MLTGVSSHIFAADTADDLVHTAADADLFSDAAVNRSDEVFVAVISQGISSCLEGCVNFPL